MRATQARAAPGVDVDQPAPTKAASKPSHEARRSSEECVGSHESHRPNWLRIATIRHGLKISFSLSLFWSFWLAISEPGWTSHVTSQKKVPIGVRLKSTRPSEIQETLRGKFPCGEIQNDDVGCPGLYRRTGRARRVGGTETKISPTTRPRCLASCARPVERGGVAVGRPSAPQPPTTRSDCTRRWRRRRTAAAGWSG